MRPQVRTTDEVIARRASRSHGVVTRRELLDAGVTPAEIRHRIGAGRLRPVHPGVYRVGHDAPSVEATYLAAVRASGGAAVLAGRAAAHNFGLSRGAAPEPETIAPTERRVSGVVCRRMRGLHRADKTAWKGIATLTVPAVLVDLAGRLEADALARVCHEAGVRHRTTPRQVEAVLGRRPNARGARRLRTVTRGETRVTLSRLESAFIELLRSEGLRLPATNRMAGGRRVDCRWPEARLTVELDSFAFHNTRASWERDRAREREAYARGDDFRRYTWADVFESPGQMLRELRGLLGGAVLDRGRRGTTNQDSGRTD